MEKHTGKFLVLITGIIIFAHSVIPHQHYFDSIEAYSGNAECNTTNSTRQGKNPEKHCHALNIVISEESSKIAVKSSLLSQVHFDLCNTDREPETALNTNNAINVIYVGFSPPKQLFLTNPSLRAPPTTV